MPTFDRGDIVRVQLNPTEGKELQGDFRPCLIISPRKFNQLGLAFIVPITNGGNQARFAGFTVPLSGSGTATQGVILVNGIRSMDLVARNAKKIEQVPDYIVDEVLAKLSAIIGIEDSV